ncbi:MAG: nuclease [Cyanobacteriota bacterium]|nr:nuclease [Cyanobacteriota bacterium]
MTLTLLARWIRLASLLLLLLPLWILPGVAEAAEVLQVRSSTLLQVGDSNRNYSVQLACVAVSGDQELPAVTWLRRQLPRRSRVNLRPISNRDGVLLARVQKLGEAQDLSVGLIAAGLAEVDASLPECLASFPEPAAVENG